MDPVEVLTVRLERGRQVRRPIDYLSNQRRILSPAHVACCGKGAMSVQTIDVLGVVIWVDDGMALRYGRLRAGVGA